MGARNTAAVLETAEAVSQLASIAEQLEAATSTIDLMTESMADLELAREDVGWRQMGVWAEQQMSRDGLNRSAALCRLMATANPLIKRGLQLRHAYVWGEGVEIEARNTDLDELTGLVQEYMRTNRDVLFGSQAQEELERVFGHDGNIFLAHFTKPRTGKVKVRSLPFVEFAERVTNPDDRDETWFYLRRWTTEEIVDGVRRHTRYEAYYPALGYRPQIRPKMLDDVEIMWDAPVLHACVNRLDGDDWGVGDAFAAIDHARGYTGFLNDWAKLMKALAKYAWRVTGESKRTAANAASSIRKNTADTAARTLPGSDGAGATAVMAGATLEAIPKSGATLDANSGRPLAAMVAAALGVPVTMLLADPGQEGARAVAATLDKPTALGFKARQRLWQTIFNDSIDYAINQAVKAPQGPLRGTVVRDEWGDELVTLAGEVDRGIKVTFPDIDEVDPKSLLEAIAIADGLDKLPDLIIVRLALLALGVEDVDTVLDTLTDDDGNFIPPTQTAGNAAIKKARDGQDPPEVL